MQKWKQYVLEPYTDQLVFIIYFVHSDAITVAKKVNHYQIIDKSY